MGLKIEIEFSDDLMDNLADKILLKGSDKLLETLSNKVALKKKLNQSEITYSVKEVSKITSKNEETIRRHIHSEILIASRPGKNYIITETNLKNYINGNH